MMGKTAFFLLLAILHQLTSTSPTPVNMITNTLNAHENQIAHADMWKNLLASEQIKISLTELKNGGHINHYKFTGDNVQSMTLKQIYYMLQNWLVLSELLTTANYWRRGFQVSSLS